jgi:hypothetical protein
MEKKIYAKMFAQDYGTLPNVKMQAHFKKSPQHH